MRKIISAEKAAKLISRQIDMLESNTVLDDVNDEEKSDNDTSDNVKSIEKVNGKMNSTDVEKVSLLLINLLLGPSEVKKNSSPCTSFNQNHI